MSTLKAQLLGFKNYLTFQQKSSILARPVSFPSPIPRWIVIAKTFVCGASAATSSSMAIASAMATSRLEATTIAEYHSILVSSD
jgi:hypothetical protein